MDPDGRPRRGHRAGERDELPEPRRADLLPRWRQRDRAPARVRLRRVREQGGCTRGEPLRDDRRPATRTCASWAGGCSGTAPRTSRSASRRGDAASPSTRRARASPSTSTASATSSSDESSSGEWLMPPFRLRTKSIAASTPAEARMPASCPAPDASSTTGRPRASIASRSACGAAPANCAGSTRYPGSNPISRISVVEPLDVGRAHVEADRTRDGMTLAPPGSTSTLPIVATAPGSRVPHRGRAGSQPPPRRAHPRARPWASSPRGRPAPRGRALRRA